MRRLGFVLVVLVAAGCAGPRAVVRDKVETDKQAAERRHQAAPPAYNLAGYPPAVRDGYIDGCESAKGTVHGRKDEKRFTADGQYSMGWNDGFSICKGKR